MAELEDAQDRGSCDRKIVRVQVSLSAFKNDKMGECVKMGFKWRCEYEIEVEEKLLREMGITQEALVKIAPDDRTFEEALHDVRNKLGILGIKGTAQKIKDYIDGVGGVEKL